MIKAAFFRMGYLINNIGITEQPSEKKLTWIPTSLLHQDSNRFHANRFHAAQMFKYKKLKNSKDIIKIEIKK